MSGNPDRGERVISVNVTSAQISNGSTSHENKYGDIAITSLSGHQAIIRNNLLVLQHAIQSFAHGLRTHIK